MKIVAMAAGVPGSQAVRAAEYLVPDIAFVDADDECREAQWPPPGREESWNRCGAGIARSFSDINGRMLFECRMLTAIQHDRVIGLFDVPEECDGVSVHGVFTGTPVHEGNALYIAAKAASKWHSARLPGVVAAVIGFDATCPRCPNIDDTKITMTAIRDADGQLKIVFLCMICAKTWGDTEA